LNSSDKCETKEIDYFIDIDSTISESLMLDKSLIMQALFQLISNAIKFTPPKGQVLVNILKLEEKSSAEKILFSVQDTGIGISEEKIQDIFDSFTQIDDSYTKEYQGLGLGLSITKAICAEMETSLKVESVVGKGSIFSFELMVQKSKKITTLSEKRHSKLIYIIESSNPNFSIACNQLSYFNLEYKVIQLQEFNEDLLSDEIVILFDYRFIKSFNFQGSKVILIEEKEEALVCSQEYANVKYSESITNCPAYVYKMISEFTDLP